MIYKIVITAIALMLTLLCATLFYSIKCADIYIASQQDLIQVLFQQIEDYEDVYPRTKEEHELERQDDEWFSEERNSK